METDVLVPEDQSNIHPAREQVVTLVLNGAHVMEVAAQFGLSWTTVYKWARAAGRTGAKRHPRKEEALALLRAGFAPTYVAQALGAARRTVYNWIAEEGLTLPRPSDRGISDRSQAGRRPLPTRRPGHPRREEALALLRAGYHTRYIARAIGASRESVVDWAFKAGILPGCAPLAADGERPLRALALLRAGMAPATIASLLGLAPRVVYKWARNAGLAEW